jgi:hypothetical protein
MTDTAVLRALADSLDRIMDDTGRWLGELHAFDHAIAAVREAADEIDRLRAAIRSHRDQRGDDRCWMDDCELYNSLGEPVPVEYSALPPKADFLASCERFYEQRQVPVVKGNAALPSCMTIRQLTDEVEELRRTNAGRGELIARLQTDIHELLAKLRELQNAHAPVGPKYVIIRSGEAYVFGDSDTALNWIREQHDLSGPYRVYKYPLGQLVPRQGG